MKIILDTNVFVSGIFWSGPPRRILDAWADGDLGLAVSPAIIDEYDRVIAEVGAIRPGVLVEPWRRLLGTTVSVTEALPLPTRVSRDPDDDKFLACALAAGVGVVVSGDRDLLAVSGYQGITVLTPAAFVRRFLSDT